jgi:hypothetical protein
MTPLASPLLDQGRSGCEIRRLSRYERDNDGEAGALALARTRGVAIRCLVWPVALLAEHADTP